MSAAWVRRRYGVDYKRGDRLIVGGRHGTLVSFPGGYLGVRFDGQRTVSRCHPTWMVEREPQPGDTVIRITDVKAAE